MDEQLTAELLLEVKKLRSELASMRGGSVAPATDQWLLGSEAWQSLQDCGVRSAAHLKRLRHDGVFGDDEIRDISKGVNPRWQYNVPRCRLAINNYFRRLAE